MVSVKENRKHEEEIYELRRIIVEKAKEMERLEKEVETAKIKTMKATGMKREELEKIVQKSLKEPEKHLTKKIKSILDIRYKTPHEKKIVLFKVIENLEVGETLLEKKKKDFTIIPIHPGEILREELLIPRNISPEELAQEIKVSKEVVKWVCEERGDITFDLAKRLSIYFDTSVELWLNLQRSYEKDLLEANPDLLKKEIVPHKEKYANGRSLREN